MKVLLNLLLGLTIQAGYSQVSDSLDVLIPKDDASPFQGEKRHLFVKERAWIGFGQDVIKVWTDNGVVDFDSIMPARKGPVKIFGKQVVKKGGGSIDTLVLERTFTAIEKPMISVKIDRDKLMNDNNLNFILFDKKTKKKLSARYEIGRLINDIFIVNKEGEILDTIHHFDDLEDFHRYLIKGNGLIIPSIAIRDMQTDLLIYTKGFKYWME